MAKRKFFLFSDCRSKKEGITKEEFQLEIEKLKNNMEIERKNNIRLVEIELRGHSQNPTTIEKWIGELLLPEINGDYVLLGRYTASQYDGGRPMGQYEEWESEVGSNIYLLNKDGKISVQVSLSNDDAVKKKVAVLIGEIPG